MRDLRRVLLKGRILSEIVHKALKVLKTLPNITVKKRDVQRLKSLFSLPIMNWVDFAKSWSSIDTNLMATFPQDH
jgi:hypothetical protein